MRLPLACIVCSLPVLVACGGGAQKPSATEADTSSLEAPSSGSDSSGGGGGSGSTAKSSTPSGGTASSSSSAASPSSTSSGAAGADAPAAPAAVHPVPGTTGSIDGKPFSPKLAQVAGPLQKDGRLLIVLHEGSDCQTSADAKPGAASMTLMVPWQDGYKVDLASLKRASRKGMGEAAVVRVGDDGKTQISTTFKPTGLVTIVSAPMQQNAMGKMKIDLQSGDYMLTGDLDVKVCFPPK